MKIAEFKDLKDFTLVTSGTGDEIELNSEFNRNFDGYLVKIKDGEYQEVYGFYGCVPFNDKAVYKVR